MRVVSAWLRLDLPRRWRSLTVLALLIGIASATVMATTAGARRGASALPRLVARTLPATTAVLANTPGFDWNKVRALPEVEAMTTFLVDYAWSIEGIPGNPGSFPPADAETMQTIEKPIIYSGRLFDPTRADEVVVSRQFVAQRHKGVGDYLIVDLPTPKELANGAEKFTGPRVKVRIVGVGSSLWFSDSPGGMGGVVLSPAMVVKYAANMITDPSNIEQPNFINALVRLRHGEADLAQFRRDIVRVTGRSDLDIQNIPDQARAIQRTLSFEARCLLAFAAAVLVAAIVLIGQAISRYSAASTAELQTLRAVGMTPRQSIATATAGPLIAALAGLVFACAAAFVAAKWFPIGTASLLEPAPGMKVDWVVFGPAIGLVLLLVSFGAALSGWLALNAARRGVSVRRSSVATALARSGAAVPVVIGARFALEAGRGRTSVPVRPALIGAVTGVLGIVAAFTFSHGVSDAADNPSRFGQTFQALAFVGSNGNDFGPATKIDAVFQDSSLVGGFSDSRTAVAAGPGGHGSVSLWEYRGSKPLPTVVTSGRMPKSASEVLLAPVSVKEIGAHIGSTVELGGSKGASRFTVVGVGLVPAGPHNNYSDGGWVTSAGYESIFKDFKFHIIFVSLRSGANADHARTAVSAAVTKSIPELQGFALEKPDDLAEIAELKQVRVLPIVLGLFLALLAVGAVGHALATAVRRRSHDLAVLRALGLTQWQCRWVVVTQASLLAVFGVAFGVPIGLAIGRSVWRVVADYTPLQYVSPIAIGVMVLVGPGALLIANLLAAWPGRRAARLRVAHILRTE